MNKPNYPCIFFRIPADSPCGQELTKLTQAIEQVENAASQFALKMGAVQYEPSERTGAGGVGMFYFAQEPDTDAWEEVDVVRDEESDTELHAAIPNESTEAGRAIIDEHAHLPMVPARTILEAIGLKVKRTKKGVKMPSFQLIEEEGRAWYYLSTFGAEFLAGRQDKLYEQGMERVSPRKYTKKTAAV